MPADPTEILAVDDDALIRPFRVVFWIIWGSLLASLAIYVVVGHVILPARPPSAPVEIVYALAAVALAIAVAAPVVRARLLPKAVPLGAPGTMRRDAAERALAPYFVAQIITLALYESIGVLGLVTTVVTANPRYIMIFVAVAAAGMLVFRPSDERMRGTLRAALLHPPQ